MDLSVCLLVFNLVYSFTFYMVRVIFQTLNNWRKRDTNTMHTVLEHNTWQLENEAPVARFAPLGMNMRA